MLWYSETCIKQTPSTKWTPATVQYQNFFPTFYLTMIKHEGHFRTWGKCRKNELQASVFYIIILSILKCSECVITECNTQLRLFHLVYDIVLKISRLFQIDPNWLDISPRAVVDYQLLFGKGTCALINIHQTQESDGNQSDLTQYYKRVNNELLLHNTLEFV